MKRVRARHFDQGNGAFKPPVKSEYRANRQLKRTSARAEFLNLFKTRFLMSLSSSEGSPGAFSSPPGMENSHAGDS